MARMRRIRTLNGRSLTFFRLSSNLIFMSVASLLFASQGGSFGVAHALLRPTPIQRSEGWQGGPGVTFGLPVAPSGQQGTLHAISGVIIPAAGGSGATVSLAGVTGAATTADGSGKYSFAGLANGRYAITPSKDGYSFSPASQAVTINDADVTDVDFTASAVHPTYTISGTIKPASAAEGTNITLSGSASLTAIADASGNYSFSGLSSGSYIVRPAKQKAIFSPVSQTVTINEADVMNVNFTVMTKGSE